MMFGHNGDKRKAAIGSGIPITQYYINCSMIKSNRDLYNMQNIYCIKTGILNSLGKILLRMRTFSSVIFNEITALAAADSSSSHSTWTAIRFRAARFFAGTVQPHLAPNTEARRTWSIASTGSTLSKEKRAATPRTASPAVLKKVQQTL